MASDRVDRSDRVGEDTPVVVGVRILDAAGDEPRCLRYPDRIGIRCLADPVTIAALPASVHDEMGVAGRAPIEPLDREPPAIAVAEVLDDTRQASLPHPRQVEPAAHGLAGITRHGDVVDLDSREPGVVGNESRAAPRSPCLLERRCPEFVEVSRFIALGSVLPQFLQRPVDEHHWFLSLARIALSQGSPPSVSAARTGQPVPVATARSVWISTSVPSARARAAATSPSGTGSTTSR